MIKGRTDCTFFVHCAKKYFSTIYSSVEISRSIWSYISRCYENVLVVPETFLYDTLRLTQRMMFIHKGC